MLDAIGEAIVGAVVHLILWPLLLVIATPPILIRALIASLSRRQKIIYAMQDGYASVSAENGLFFESSKPNGGVTRILYDRTRKTASYYSAAW